MKIGIQTWGSDGDILPFMALATGLQAAGHEVIVAYTSVDNKNYDAYSTLGGFKCVKAYDEFTVGMHDVLAPIVQTRDPLKQFIMVMEKFFDPAVEAMYEASRQLCLENDIVVGHMMNHTLLTAAEKFKRPRISVALAPLAIRTKYIPLFGPNLGSILNRITWMLGDYVGRKKLFTRAEVIRQREGLPPLQSLQQQLYVSKDLTLVASSPTLTVRRPDWTPNIQICGDFRFEESDRYIPMPEGLEDFLNAGAPPVYVTFGSLGPFESETIDNLIVDAIEKVGCRAVIQSAWNGKTGPDIFRCNSAPHAQVFPRCAVVVHHGGAGTTHSALRAGCPSVVIEHAFDQQFWGSELQKLGAGSEVLHRNTLTIESLAKAIQKTINDDGMQSTAKSLGRTMRFENGVQRAIELIEEKFLTPIN